MIPKCINCKYYLTPILGSSIHAEAKCMKFLRSDIKFNADIYKHYFGNRSHLIASRPDIYQYAYIARGDRNMCGPIGTKFVSNK